MFKKTIQTSLKSLAVLGLLCVLNACGSSSTTSPTFNSVEYVVVNAGTLSATPTNLSGAGSLVFKAPLSQVGSKNSYRVTFTLQDTGSVTLVANSTVALASGVSVKFTRSGNTLNASLITTGGTTDISSRFTGVDASTALTYQVDVHNDESPAHVLLWDSAETSFTTAAARVNSENSGLNALGQGTGTYWGLVLDKATVTAAVLSTAKFSE